MKRKKWDPISGKETHRQEVAGTKHRSLKSQGEQNEQHGESCEKRILCSKEATWPTVNGHQDFKTEKKHSQCHQTWEQFSTRWCESLSVRRGQSWEAPTLAPRQLSKSLFMSDTATLSWGLLGPLQQGTTVFKSNSTTCSPKWKEITEIIHIILTKKKPKPSQRI